MTLLEMVTGLHNKWYHNKRDDVVDMILRFSPSVAAFITAELCGLFAVNKNIDDICILTSMLQIKAQDD